MSDQKKDPLDIKDLPEKDQDGADVKGGMISRPPTMKSDCNSNTLTCKDTSTTNTLCCG